MSSPASQLPREQSQPDATPLRFVTAASLFDGHDAAINVMRRIIQAQGAEVIHLGHNRSVEDVVRAALQEDADAIALSSYQGGHVEYLKYMIDMLKERNAEHIRVFAGGGGTITPEEIKELEAYGVERIYHPNDGMHMGLVAMIEDVVRRAARARDQGLGTRNPDQILANVDVTDEISVGHMLSALEDDLFSESELAMLRKQWAKPKDSGARTPVIGLTGTGGAGKSSRGGRAAAALPARLPRDAHRRAGGRSHPPPLRWRAAGRPHPHELAALGSGVHALHGHAPAACGHQRGAEGLHRLPAEPAL